MAYDILTDLWIISLPIPMIQRLKMSLARRISAIVMFSLGAVCCAIAVARSLAIRTSMAAHIAGDVTRGDVPVMIWSLVEVGIGVLCACIVTLKQPVARLLKVSLEAGTKLGGRAGVGVGSSGCGGDTAGGRRQRDTLCGRAGSCGGEVGLHGLHGSMTTTTTTITADKSGFLGAAMDPELGKDVWGRKETQIIMERVSSPTIREEPDEDGFAVSSPSAGQMGRGGGGGVEVEPRTASLERLVRGSWDSMAVGRRPDSVGEERAGRSRHGGSVYDV